MRKLVPATLKAILTVPPIVILVPITHSAPPFLLEELCVITFSVNEFLEKMAPPNVPLYYVIKFTYPLKIMLQFKIHRPLICYYIRDEFKAPIAPPIVAEFSSKYTSPLIDLCYTCTRKWLHQLLLVKEVHVVLVFTRSPLLIYNMAPPSEYLFLAVLFRKELQPVIMSVRITGFDRTTTGSTSIQREFILYGSS